VAIINDDFSIAPAVSVIIPFRNRLPWVVESIGSVTGQTFGDFEIILVDDGSDSDLEEIMSLTDTRIRYLRQDKKGAAAARNHGIEHARGRYIAFLDSDDLFLPHKLETQCLFMEEHPSVGLSHTAYFRINENADLIDLVQTVSNSDDVYPDIVCGCCIATPTVMIRTKVLTNHRFNESLQYGEDVLLWIQLARTEEIAVIKTPLSKIRIHGANAIFDNDRQLSVGSYIIRQSFKEDPSLTFTLRLKAFSSLYIHQAYLMYKKHSYLRVIQYTVLSFLFIRFRPLNTLSDL